jgi:2-polyprenyl-6-methoxyphenol hydroxylase-like FAD-dependent oxidoreductase
VKEITVTTVHPDPVPPSADVIVVGARAAGAATAMLLARSGLRVLVLERSRYGTDTLSTHALMRAGVIQLRRWGLLDAVVAAGTPPVRRTVFRYGAEVLPVTIKPSHGIDALYAPRRTVIDPILVDAAVASGADVRFGSTVTDLVRDAHGTVVGVDARDVGGRPFRTMAPLVVGADGRGSIVAERAGARVTWSGANAGAVVYGYWRGVPTDGYEWIFQPGRAAGLIPTNDDVTCVFAGGPPSVIGRGGRAVLDAVVAAADPGVFDRLALGEAPAGVRSFTGLPGHLRQAWGPGWALVGDAGYWKDPLSAHGMTDALRDAELLARAAVAVAGGERPARAFGEYEAWRDRLSRPLLETADELAGYRWDADEIGPLLMRMSSAMSDEVDVVAAFDTAPPLAVPAAGAVAS